MNTRGSRLAGCLAVALLLTAPAAPAYADGEQFTLAGAVPNDVFLYVAERHNPEREFLDKYWGEVFDALAASGVGDDLLELLGTALGEEGLTEVERLKERATQLVAGVDWGQLAGKEMAFAERLGTPLQSPDGDVFIWPPDLVWIFRGSTEGAAQNFEGLAAILEAVVEEINGALEAEVLTVDRTPRMGAQVASVNVLMMLPDAPALPIAVARRDDLVLIVVGEQILGEVLGLLDGSGSKLSLADDARFQAAFTGLPPAEDTMTYFDMQALLKSVRMLVDTMIAKIGAQRDVYRNTGMSTAANELNARAVAAYLRKDYQQALTLTEQAHEVAPKDSIVLYNLACFSALVGDRDEALNWLEQAVEAGFHAPGKIAGDSDLKSLRTEPRYQAALKRAAELAACFSANDIVRNSTKTGKAYELSTQAWEAYKEKDFERGLKLVQQAHEVSPNDSRVLYYLACFHALLGHEDKALDFLERAVDGGFCCPRHISSDPDLESIRDDQRYQAALDQARKRAADICAEGKSEEEGAWLRVVERLLNAVGILDYTAAVQSTEGYAVTTESVAVLMPDAHERPIYPVFGKCGRVTNFDRYLPQETLSFSVAGGIDLGALYTFIEDSIRMAGPPGEGLLEKWRQLQEELGVDVQNDVLAWIGGTIISVTLENGEGSVLLIEVTDEELARDRISAAIEFLSAKLTELAAENPPLWMLAVNRSPVHDERLAGFENLQLVVAPQPIIWGVADGHLIFGTSAKAVALCLDTAKGKHPGIRENARAMSEALVPTGPFCSVSLTDYRGLGDELAQLIGAVSVGTRMMGAFIRDPEVRPVITKIAGILAKLTPVVRKIDFYKSTAANTTFDGQAWHTKAVTHYFSPDERSQRRAADMGE